MTTQAQSVPVAEFDVTSSSAKLTVAKTHVELLVITSVILGAVGQLLLKASLLLLNPHANSIVGSGNPRIFCAIGIFIGLSVYAVGTLFWIRAVSRAAISYLYPLTASSYALVALGGHLLFNEVVHPWRWAGIGVMCVGIALLAVTNSGSAS
jgi:drug/metabolite transporter (DMT)-like permease